MGYGPRDSTEVARDLVVAFFHPEYREQRPIETLAELKRNRRRRA